MRVIEPRLPFVNIPNPTKDSSMRHQGYRRAMRVVAAALLALTAAGCAMFEDMVTPDEDGAQVSRNEAEASTLFELSIMTGRYGVMLDQAREILRLPSQRSTVFSAPADQEGIAAQRVELARQQAAIANEFLGDAKKACQRRRLPKDVKAIACETRRTMPAELRTPVNPELPSLQKRSDDMGEFIITWWEVACAAAPKRRDDEPVCPME
jgi:hypothetical protein